MRFYRLFLLCAAIIPLIAAVYWRSSDQQKSADAQPTASPANVPHTNQFSKVKNDRLPTRIHAHNLILRKGPDFRVYVRWLDGQLARTRKSGNPSLGDPDSFMLDIRSGVLRANIGDIGHFLNAGLTKSPLTNVVLSADGDKLKLTGTIHKVFPLPIQVLGEVSATPDDRIRLHITKLAVLKVPLKGLLHLFHLSLTDLVKPGIEGVEIAGGDLLFDTRKLLPPPHIRGDLTAVRVVSPDLEEVFGDASEDLERVEQWRNFLSLKGGVIDFGSLTMNGVDLIMIDISKDPWFDLDLVNYQTQLTAGYSRMTASSGLQIFMPDRRDVKPASGSGGTDIEWFKNRNIPPPPQISRAAR